MIIALKHNDTFLIGKYETLLEFALSNFKFTVVENGSIKVTSGHFQCYINKEYTSTVSYSNDYTDEEKIKDYIRYSFKKDIKQYGVNYYKIDER